MNYISEIKAFYDWLELNQIDATHISLWHSLMYIANKTGWQQEFTVPMSTLELKTGLKRGAIYNARNKLKQLGLIDFKERGGNQCSVYMLKSLCLFNEHKDDTTTTETRHKDDTTTTESENITKRNETKQDIKKDDFVISKSHGQIIQAWNALKLQELKIIQGKREELLNTRIKEYGENAIFEAIENIKKSSFLRGQNKTGFIITFDWFVRPNNFPKVLEGNYTDKSVNLNNDEPSGRMGKFNF